MPAQSSVFWKAESPNARNVKPPAKGGGQKAPAGQASSGGSGRYVRTQAGVNRYKVPIGAEIKAGSNPHGQRAQRHKPSTGRYKALVGANPKAQAAALSKLNRTQLGRLLSVASSFPSNHPAVARLRAGVASMLKRKYNVDANTYLRHVGVKAGGSVGDPFAKSGKKKAPAPAERVKANLAPKTKRKRTPMTKPKRRKTPVVSARSNSAAARRKMMALSTPSDLRRAVGVFGKVAPDKREKVARYLVDRAVELSAVHFLGQAVIEAANVDWGSDRGQRVLELAGRWKHGWIPLDAAALSEKMKGKTGGKKWWSGEGAHGRVGGSGKGSGSGGGAKAPKTGSGNAFEAWQAGEKQAAGKPPSARDRATLETRAKETGGDKRPWLMPPKEREAHESARGGAKRTNVVKSESNRSTTRGAKVIPKMTPEQIRVEQRVRADAKRGIDARSDASFKGKTGLTRAQFKDPNRTGDEDPILNPPTKDSKARALAAARAVTGRGVSQSGGKADVAGFKSANKLPANAGNEEEKAVKAVLAKKLGIPNGQLVNNGNFYYLDRKTGTIYLPQASGGWAAKAPGAKPGKA